MKFKEKDVEEFSGLIQSTVCVVLQASAHAEFPEDQPIEEIHCILEPKVLASRRHRAWRPRFVQIGKKLLKAGFKVS